MEITGKVIRLGNLTEGQVPADLGVNRNSSYRQKNNTHAPYACCAGATRLPRHRTYNPDKTLKHSFVSSRASSTANGTPTPQYGA